MLRKLQSPKGDTSGYDEVWLVVDEDGRDMARFVEACNKLNSKSQRWFPVVSRPCFEVWLIAHYEQVRRYQDQHDAQRHYRALIPPGTPKKLLPADFPFNAYGEASTACRLSDSTAEEANALPPSPGSGMHHLIRALFG